MRRGSFLLVEDNRDDEALILRALRRSDIATRVVVAHDGAAALELLGDEPLPDVVLLDLNLPRLSGLDVLRRIRADARTRHLVVVVLTSSREDRDVTNAYAAGANSYVRKPIDSEEFAETIQLLGRYWLGLNEAGPPADR